MNLFQLIFKQMRQRALSTWLTILSVVLGVALGCAIMLLQREGGKLIGQTDYGFDVLVGAKGSPQQLVMNTVYQIDQSPGNVPYSLYEQLISEPRYRADVRIAVPTAVGDTYQGQRIIATLPKLFGVDDDGHPLPPERVMEYRPDKRYELAEGQVFHPRKFQAVIGADVPKLAQLKLGSEFQATHGAPEGNQQADTHEEKWKVVGVLKPTNTAADRVIYIPLTTFYAIMEHEQALGAIAQLQGNPAPATREAHDDHDHGHAHPAHPPHLEHHEGETPEEHAKHAHEEHAGHDDHADHAGHAGHDHGHYTMNPDGTIEVKLPKEQWMISAIMVRSRRPGFSTQNLMWTINNQNIASAVNPAGVMKEFFDTFLRPSSRMLEWISYLVSIVAGVAILVSIYNSISARMREIAILRALGATRTRILTLICLEAGFIGLIGGVLGLVLAHVVLGVVASQYMERLVGEGINWLSVGVREWIYLGAVLVLSVLAGLVPALKAYEAPVATNLVAS